MTGEGIVARRQDIARAGTWIVGLDHQDVAARCARQPPAFRVGQGPAMRTLGEEIFPPRLGDPADVEREVRRVDNAWREGAGDRNVWNSDLIDLGVAVRIGCSRGYPRG